MMTGDQFIGRLTLMLTRFADENRVAPNVVLMDPETLVYMRDQGVILTKDGAPYMVGTARAKDTGREAEIELAVIAAAMIVGTLMVGRMTIDDAPVNVVAGTNTVQ